jgi:hypothetical protein
VRSGEGYEFRPTTTVHDVALIPNYFSSGEEMEDHYSEQQRQPIQDTQRQQYQRSLNNNMQANYFYHQQNTVQVASSGEEQEIYIEEQTMPQ